MNKQNLKKARLFVIAAPSGAGKTSLVKALVDQSDNIQVSISYTTRAMRPDEVNGVNYHFVTVSEFEKITEQQGFLESAQVFKNRYGTHRQTVDQLLVSGKHLILEIDWQGVQQVKQRMPEAQSIFILPPSMQSLRDRLMKRGQDNQETIESRMAEAISEISHYHEFDYLLVNDDFDTALRQIEAIVQNQATELAISRQKDRLSTLLAELLP
ncbi:MAG: guanylate kinase [bacterium]